jgi:hypothetical protein
MNHLPPNHWKLKLILGHFKYCWKFVEILASQGVPPRINENGGIGGKFCLRYHWWRWYRWQICHQCQRYQLKVATGIYDTGGKFATIVIDRNNIRLLTSYSELEGKIFYLFVDSTAQRCPDKEIKALLIEDFVHLPPVLPTLVVHLELQISLQIFEIFETALMGNSGLRGNWFIKKPEVENLVALSL